MQKDSSRNHSKPWNSNELYGMLSGNHHQMGKQKNMNITRFLSTKAVDSLFGIGLINGKADFAMIRKVLLSWQATLCQVRPRSELPSIVSSSFPDITKIPNPHQLTST